MKILHVLGAAEDTGGILSVIRGLHTAAAGWGDEQVLLVHRSYRETRQPRLAYRYSRHLLAECPNHWRLLLGAILALKELKNLLRVEHFDALHAHTRGSLPVAIVVACLWRRPMVFTNHAFARRRGLYRWAARRRRLRTCVLNPSMARHYGLVPGTRDCTVISACCDDRFFAAPLRSPNAAKPPGPVRLVGLGNLVRWKNWHLLLEAHAALNPQERERLQFHHWGPTPSDFGGADYAVQLQQQVRDHRMEGLWQFHGVSLAVETVLRDAEWFVLPSTNEPCSVALIEALALGVPAIASASGGNVDIIRAGTTGLLFTPDSAPDLTRILRQIIHGEVQPAPPTELRESVRQRSATVVARQYRELYSSLCADTVASAPRH